MDYLSADTGFEPEENEMGDCHVDTESMKRRVKSIPTRKVAYSPDCHVMLYKQKILFVDAFIPSNFDLVLCMQYATERPSSYLLTVITMIIPSGKPSQNMFRQVSQDANCILDQQV